MEKGPVKKLSIYVDETDKYGGKPVYEVLMNLFYKKKIAGASVFRGIAGYGGDGKVHSTKMLELSVDLPLKIEVIESEEVIQKILPDVQQIVERGLIELSDTHMLKATPPKPQPAKETERMKLEGKAKMLRIIVSEDDRWEGVPLYEAIAKRLIMNDIAGATIFRGIAGYGPHRRYHKKKTLTSTGELPIIISVVDSEEKIATVLPILDDMVHEGIVIMSNVDVIKYSHRDGSIIDA